MQKDTPTLAPPPAKKSDDPRTYTNIDTVPITLLERASGYWNTLYRRRRRVHDVSIRQILLGQLFIVVFVGTFSILIEDNKEALLLVGSTLILYPSLADLLVSNSAVLSSSTHHEYDDLVQKKVTTVILNTVRAITAAFLASVLVGIVAGILSWWLFGSSIIETVKLAALAGSIAGVIGLPIMQLITFIARNLKSNPDEVAPPIENVFFNVVVLIAIVVSSRILS